MPIDENVILKTVMPQRTAPLLLGGMHILLDPAEKSEKSYAEFVEITKQKEIEFYGEDTDVSIETMEDMYWEKVTEFEGNYAIDNQMTMFPVDVCSWNLDRLTKKDSIIHAAITHHSWKVGFLNT